MTITTEAIYEHGVLKLSKPIPLAEGSRVEVIVVSTQQPELSITKKVLAELSALPLEGEFNEFSGQEHDKLLYPNSDAT